MLRNFIHKGFLLGLNAGLIVTLFDGFYMLGDDVFVPPSYPVFLIIFNLFFWTGFGLLSGCTQWLFAQRKQCNQRDEAYYQIFYFLLPFALVYGILGRLYIPLPPPPKDASLLPVVYDHHLSFVWAFLVIIFISIYYKLNKINKITNYNFFRFEVVAIIVIFNFCSNNSSINKLDSFVNPKNIKLFGADIFSYTSFVLAIIGCYLLLSCILQKFISKYLVNYLKYFTSIICICVISTLFITYLFKHTDKNNNISSVIDDNLKATDKISPVMLIVLDTVRADRLSVYGYPRAHSNLEEFSRNALVFEKCIASSSWTLPTHASLFTGFYPSEHGLHYSERLGKKDPRSLPPLSDDFVTLAELFSDNGYRTAAIVSNHGYVNSHYKLDQGFQIFDSRSSIGRTYFQYPFRPILHLFSYLTNIFPEFILPYRNAAIINDLALPVLNQLSESSFFMFLNYNDAHEFYSAPRPFGVDIIKSRFPRLETAENYYLTHFSAKLDKKDCYAYLQSEYDYEIAFLDTKLGELFSQLKKLGIYDKALIIITSDHGQLLGEHNLFAHQSHLYDGALRVPLMIKFPFSKTVGRERKLMILSELYSKIISICNLTVPEDIQKKILSATSPPVVAEIYGNNVGIKHLALYDGRYKYMTYQRWMAPKLYDLENDPNEEINVADRFPAVMESMAEKLKDWEDSHTPIFFPSKEPHAPLSEESLMDLKALGYIE